MKKYGFLILGLIFLDALSKYWAESILVGSLSLIPNILSLEYAENIGIAFSIPLTGMLLKTVTVILIFGIFWYYWKEEKKKDSKLLDISYSLIFAGAIGNAWERIFRSYVTDMISLEYFAIFNLADSYITLGAIGIIYYYLKNKS
ncbi:signal peptidase II [Candidatus Gracilibacteria bacterium]|nr:signal peptidase II [Candidatus Gracilibacteria bacterium]